MYLYISVCSFYDYIYKTAKSAGVVKYVASISPEW